LLIHQPRRFFRFFPSPLSAFLGSSFFFFLSSGAMRFFCSLLFRRIYGSWGVLIAICCRARCLVFMRSLVFPFSPLSMFKVVIWFSRCVCKQVNMPPLFPWRIFITHLLLDSIIRIWLLFRGSSLADNPVTSLLIHLRPSGSHQPRCILRRPCYRCFLV